MVPLKKISGSTSCNDEPLHNSNFYYVCKYYMLAQGLIQIIIVSIQSYWAIEIDEVSIY